MSLLGSQVAFHGPLIVLHWLPYPRLPDNPTVVPHRNSSMSGQHLSSLRQDTLSIEPQ